MKNSDRQAFGYGIPGDEKAGWLPENVEGLTKREYFAGLAMQGILASGVPLEQRIEAKDVASECLCLADALLKQLEQ